MYRLSCVTCLFFVEKMKIHSHFMLKQNGDGKESV